MPRLGPETIKQAKLDLDRVLVAAEDLRGVLVEPNDDRAVLVATDGHRLAMVESYAIPAPKEPTVLARRAVALLRSLLAADSYVALEWTIDGLRLETKIGHTVARPQDARSFPPWRQVMPAQGRPTIEISRLKLLQAFKAERHAEQEIVLAPILDGLYLRSSKAPKDHLGTLVEGAWTSEAEGPIGLSAHYLEDLLAGARTKRISLSVGGPMDAVEARQVEAPEAWRHVLMPMKI